MLSLCAGRWTGMSSASHHPRSSFHTTVSSEHAGPQQRASVCRVRRRMKPGNSSRCAARPSLAPTGCNERGGAAHWPLVLLAQRYVFAARVSSANCALIFWAEAASAAPPAQLVASGLGWAQRAAPLSPPVHAHAPLTRRSSAPTAPKQEAAAVPADVVEGMEQYVRALTTPESEMEQQVR